MSTDNPICVALCANSNILSGLHVTLFSALSHTRSKVHIFLIHDGLNDGDIRDIHCTLSSFSEQYELVVIEGKSESFKSFRGIQGDHFTYMRLQVPELIFVNRVIYLDSDLLVNVDLKELFDQDMKGYTLAAVDGGDTMSQGIDRELFKDIGLPGLSPYFNAGVLLIDSARWRQNSVFETCCKFAARHAKRLMAADQTVLNFIFQGNYLSLEPRFNVQLYPSRGRVDNGGVSPPQGDCIYHFVGAPKPWDTFGAYFHGNFFLWDKWFNRTGYKNPYINPLKKIIRTVRISLSYYRSFKYRKW